MWRRQHDCEWTDFNVSERTWTRRPVSKGSADKRLLCNLGESGGGGADWMEDSRRWQVEENPGSNGAAPEEVIINLLLTGSRLYLCLALARVPQRLCLSACGHIIFQMWCYV